jgi:hypothetical protein
MKPAGVGDGPRWETAFVALGAIAGESTEAVASALGEAGRAHAADLLRALAATSREARARALARAVSDVVLAIDAMRCA